MKILILTSILAVFLFSCKKDIQPTLQELDCDCAKEVSADFLMEEMTTGNINFAKYTDTELIYGDKNVRFTALDESADYTWYIGTEIIKTKEVTRFFSNSMIGQTVPIILVTKKNANTICFPKDDGYDSIIKYLTIVSDKDNFDTTLIEGIYRVKSPLVADSFDIIVDITKNLNLGWETYYVNLYNYNGLDSNCISLIKAFNKNYRQIFLDDNFTTMTECQNLDGNILLKKDNTVEFNLITGFQDYEPMPLKKIKYLGRKL